MSNFAERLAARSAGAPPPGISMLAPRPVSRFEPAMGVEVEAIADAGSSVTAPVADETETTSDPAVIASPIESRASSRPSRRAPDAAAPPLALDMRMPRYETRPSSAVARRAAPQLPPPVAGETPQARPVVDPFVREVIETPVDASKIRSNAEIPPDATSQPYARADAMDTRASAWPPVPELVAPPPVPERTSEVHTGRTERHTIAFERERVPMVHQTKVEAPPAPTISIGKIEVQFLPQEPRAPTQRPQPERTRGFAAYARARRGEPR